MSEESFKQKSTKKECSHSRATAYFGPVYSCPDCGAMPIRDINKSGRQWRKKGGE